MSQITTNHKSYLISTLQAEKATYENLIQSGAKSDDLLSSLNNIIEFKKMLEYTGDDSIYLDYKLLFKLYLKAIQEKDSGYDHVSLEHIINKFKFLEPLKRVDLILNFKRELNLNGYTEFANECDDYLNLAKFDSLVNSRKSPTVIFNIIILWSSLNVKNLILVITAFYVITATILLPAFNSQYALFSSDFHHYSNTNYLNYLLNVLTLFFDLDDGMTVKSESSFGILLIITGKIIYIVILVNYFAKNLVERFQKH